MHLFLSTEGQGQKSGMCVGSGGGGVAGESTGLGVSSGLAPLLPRTLGVPPTQVPYPEFMWTPSRTVTHAAGRDM